MAEDRATDRLREAAFLGWQMVGALGGKAPTFDKYLTALGLKPKRRAPKGAKAREVARAKRNAAKVRAAFDKERKVGSP